MDSSDRDFAITPSHLEDMARSKKSSACSTDSMVSMTVMPTMSSISKLSDRILLLSGYGS